MILSHLRRVVARFPMVVVLLIGFAYFVLDVANGLLLRNFERSQQLAFAFLSAAILALAGSLFREGHEGRRLGQALGLVLPFVALLAVAASPSIAVHRELVLCTSVLWLSVAGHVGRPGGEMAFAWLNRVAVWEGIFALLLAGIVSLALVAIDSALSMLFGLRHLDIVEFGVPLALCLLGPLFWLGRLPVLSDYRAGASESDFLARSVQLVGTFALTPFLFVYAAILIVYMGQMIVFWRLPSNTIGWMVLGFLVTGTANWLLLAGANGWPHIRLFRRFWFALTLPPLLLLIYAAFLRVDAYGITPNRVVLMVGAIWGLGLAGFYIARRGDLRLIPFLGAIGLAAIAVGPLNLNVVSARDQASRLEKVLRAAGVSGLASARPLNPRENSIAAAAMNQLFFDPATRLLLDRTLARFGIVMTAEQYPYDLLQALGYKGSQDALRAEEGTVTRSYFRVELEEFPPLDLTETPVFLGEFDLYGERLIAAGPLALAYDGDSLLIADEIRDPPRARRLSLAAWLSAETGSSSNARPIRFTEDGIDYLALPKTVTGDLLEQDGKIWHELSNVDLLLFRARNETETGPKDQSGQDPETRP